MTTGRRKNGNGHTKRSLAARGSSPIPRPTPTPTTSEAKRALPVISEPRAHNSKLPSTPTCTSCGLCCSYVAIEVDSPVTVKQATQLLWYVYHEGISLYVNDDDWMVQFDSTCIHLQPDYRCGVYETRPHICREFSEQDCEVNTGDDGRTFYTASEYLEHLSKTRPRIHAIVKKSFSPPAEAERSRLAPFEHRFAAVMSRRSALGI
jgi:Fe-S-cluster containining protein